MDRRSWTIAAIFAALFLLALFVGKAPRKPGSQQMPFAQSLQPPTGIPSPNAPLAAPNADATYLSNKVAPAPEALVGDPQAQSLFDANAQPGDFVTPPVISVAH